MKSRAKFCIMSKRIHIQLTENERRELEQLIRQDQSSVCVQRRARILLLSDRNQTEPPGTGDTVRAVMCSAGTVINVKKRYLAEGLQAALHDKPRPGAKPKITGEVEAHLIALACSDPPAGRDRWTLRLLADQLVELELVESISHVAVGEVLKKTNSSPGG
jgi:transposase